MLIWAVYHLGSYAWRIIYLGFTLLVAFALDWFTNIAGALFSVSLLVLADFEHNLHVMFHNHVQEVTNILLLGCHGRDHQILLETRVDPASIDVVIVVTVT